MDPDQTELEEALEDLPPSPKLVYKVLEYEGDLTQLELAEHTRLPRRTVRYSLEMLMDHELVDDRPSLHDARQSFYTINK